MQQESIIDISELQIALNHLDESIGISYPLYNFDLFTAKQLADSVWLRFDCAERDFDKAAAAFGRDESEMPTYYDFRDCLRSSGVMPYKNIEEFKKKLKNLRGMKKTVKFSLDTNMLYQGFISGYGLVKPSEIVLVDIVLKEIRASLNTKYKPSDIEHIKRRTRYQKQLVDELRNKRTKRSRKAAYLASREYQYLTDGIADIIKAHDRGSTKEGENDRTIVRTLIEFDKTSPTLPVLLTADDAMVDLCEAEGLEYFKFDMPYDIRNSNCSYYQLNELIFNLAAVFGFVKLDSVIVFGEFSEKTSNRPNELKLRFLNEKLYDCFSQDLDICRGLLELDI